MNRRFLGIALALLLIVPLCVVSCGDDGTTDPGNGTPANLPDLPEAEIGTTIDFQNDNPQAQAAEGLVQTQLVAAQAISSMSAGLLAPLESAAWGNAGNDCWSWSYTYEGCTATYEVCETAEGYAWTFTMDGTCIEGESAYDNWVAWSGTTNSDGTLGTMQWYDSNTTTVIGSCTWSVAADRSSGTWNFYEGTVATANLIATMAWRVNQDGSQDITWTMPEVMKWEAHVAADGLSGWMRLYSWESNSWVLTGEITWMTNGTGWWKTYNSEGEVITEDIW